jgi:ribonucleotide reductase beta subunit family protein with ferritin-like domain
MSNTTITLGERTFILDKKKAEEAFENKRVINGRQSMFFNILPIKYQWAYDLYKTMKNNHWEPEDIQMQKDVEQWRSSDITEGERWIVKMGLGYFSAAEGIVGDNILHVVRELVTAPELKLVLGRHAHEENIHADSLVYMLASLGLNPHECEAMFEDVPSIKAKNSFVVNNSRALRRDMDMTLLENKQALAKNIFMFGQVMEGTQFYGLFGMLFSLYRQNKFPGVGQMFAYTCRDECLTEDHDLLTADRGWVSIAKLQPSDKIAQYHSDGSITFTKFDNPTFSEVPHTFEFNNAKGHVSLSVSENHRMVMRPLKEPISGSHGDKLNITKAINCQHNPYSAHICAGKLKSDKAVQLTDEERFLIAWQADGHTLRKEITGTKSDTLLVRFVLTRPRKLKRLENLCSSLGYSLVTKAMNNRDSTACTVRVPLSMLNKKRFKEWVTLSDKCSSWCAEFIDELSYWDGHRVQGKTRRITWGNISKDDVDLVQTVAALAGYRTHYKKIEDTRYTPAAVYHRLNIHREKDYFRGNAINKTKKEGTKLVYGVSVPTGMILTRRDNCVGVTGNSNHIEVFRNLLMDLITENPEIWTPEFKEELRCAMLEGISLEKEFIKDCLPVSGVGMNSKDFEQYIDYIANRRLTSCALAPLTEKVTNPFPWLAEMMDIKKEQNFFEGRVTEYQKASSLTDTNDDDL